jgi:pyruvate decarboxylase
MYTIGSYLAKRLEDVGINDYFAIPGDYNLVLLDELLKNKSIRMVNCCNELNTGYAADGYARINGIAAAVVTYGVGSLSIVNAVAGSYAENLPVLLISGGPNTSSIQDAEVLHHTLADDNHLFVRDIYEHITACSVRVTKPEQAAAQIDSAIAIALREKKPVYIEIACNIANFPISSPTKRAFNATKISDSSSLKAAVEAAANMLNQATKPVLICGSKMRACNAMQSVSDLSLAAQYALAVMPDAKGFISEAHPNFIGIYWGQVSWPNCAEIVDSSDAYLVVGANENDYTTVGHTWGITPENSVSIKEGHVHVRASVYTDVYMNDFLRELQKVLKPNDKSLKAYQRLNQDVHSLKKQNGQQVLTRQYLFSEIQAMLSADFGVLVETGDSWFNGMDLHLPEGCPFEIQMQYGSIGWSVGATLGMQSALAGKKRVVACIGDGSFQMGAQEVSTMIRYGFKSIIFLMNNAAYNIEVQIHDGPYNVINNWRYEKLLDVFDREHNKSQGFVVKTNGELDKAILAAKKSDKLCFIEAILDKDDCNKNLLEWGSRVAKYNSRSPRS